MAITGKKKMKWSFDDLHIGKTSTGTSLTERIVPRPRGLSNNDWYKFAGQTIKLLNEPSRKPKK